MAYTQDDALVSYKSDADYSADGTGQYRAVKLTTTGFVLCGANTVNFLGILQDDPATGKFGSIKTQETSKAEAGAAIAITDKLTTDSSGRLVAATSGQNVVAIPLAAAAGAGELIPVRIRPGGVA